MSIDKVPITVRGLAALEEELKHRQQVERQRIIQAIAEARALGDLSENAEYHAAKEAQSHNEGRVLELEIAAWLHLPGLSELPVSLLVSYLDGNQSHEVPIDHGRLDMRQRILLSGVARLPVRQQLAAVELRLRSAVAPRSVRIEDIFVQPVTSVLI